MQHQSRPAVDKESFEAHVTTEAGVMRSRRAGPETRTCSGPEGAVVAARIRHVVVAIGVVVLEFSKLCRTE